jgi:hypothetical protein
MGYAGVNAGLVHLQLTTGGGHFPQGRVCPHLPHALHEHPPHDWHSEPVILFRKQHPFRQIRINTSISNNTSNIAARRNVYNPGQTLMKKKII